MEYGTLDQSALPTALTDRRTRFLRSGELQTHPAVADPARYGSLEAINQDVILETIARCGFWLGRLAEPPDLLSWVAFGSKLGWPIDEDDPALFPHCPHPAVLNVAPHYTSTLLQERPLTDRALGLHTEMSGSPVAGIPGLLAFVCHWVSPSSTGTAPATILRDQQSVHAALTPTAADVLRATRMSPSPASPHVIEGDGPQARLAFRDTLTGPWRWQSKNPSAAVAGALVELLSTAYDASEALSIPWRLGDVLVLDNRTMLHGRSDGQGSQRALWRLRLR